MIIDKTFFIGEIAIAGIENTLDGAPLNLDYFIEKYEPEFLHELLGEDLFNDFKAGLLIAPIPSKWTDLKARLEKAFGTNFPKDHCPIAKFVYHQYWIDKVTQASPIGEVVANSENSIRVSSDVRLVTVWNSMVDDNYEIARWLTSYPEIYSYEWQLNNWHKTIFKKKNRFNL